MKITFEGNTFRDVLVKMRDALVELAPLDQAALLSLRSNPPASESVAEKSKKTTARTGEFAVRSQGPSPDVFGPVDKPVDEVVDEVVEKPAKPKVDRVAAMNKARAAKEAKKAAAAPAPAPATLPDLGGPVDPAEIVKIRQKTIEDLQSAYANGFQKEVFELLARFGNGAKSFRELPPDAFVPIREAIDNGALT